MMGLGMHELLIILAIVMLLFGSTKLPQLARSLGTSIHEFKDSLKTAQEQTKEENTAAKPKEEEAN